MSIFKHVKYSCSDTKSATGFQSYWEITSDKYFDYIKEYVVGIGPWKDTIVPESDNYLQTPTDLVARAHAHNLQVPKPYFSGIDLFT